MPKSILTTNLALFAITATTRRMYLAEACAAVRVTLETKIDKVVSAKSATGSL